MSYDEQQTFLILNGGNRNHFQCFSCIQHSLKMASSPFSSMHFFRRSAIEVLLVMMLLDPGSSASIHLQT
ncbi:unnamed protein product [Amoebophrya sp. A25]|nr:unnamed protein product [Amoebophrya sp. A25]|eukprot:GSA25T00024804001.1